MGRRDTWLGYVAIGVGVLALLMSLGGGFRGSRVALHAPYGGGWEQSAPAPGVPEDQLFCRRGPGACAPHVGPGGGPGMMWQRHDYHGGFGFFGMIWWLLSSLVKLGLAILAILVGLRFLRGRGGSGGPGQQVPITRGPVGNPSGGTELRAAARPDQTTYL